MQTHLRNWFPLYSVLALCAVCLTAWAFIIPIFESPDEPHHWAYTHYVHSHFALPPYNGQYVEGNQAPFYYCLMAPLASASALPLKLVSLDKGALALTCLPHFFQNCKSDLYKYLPIRKVRLATAALSLVGILFTALAAFEITTSRSSAVMAAALIGLLPQFDFRGASINNDAAAASMSAVATYFVVRLSVRGFERIPALLGAVAIALALLSKINSVVVVPAFAACLLLSSRDWNIRLRRLAVLAVSAILVLPWLIYNKIVYGDLLASRIMQQVVPSMIARRSITDPYFYTTFPVFTYQSLIGYFGWLNVPLPEPIYWGYAVLFVAALLGLILLMLRESTYRLVITLLSSIPLLSVAVMINFNMTFPQPQGRLLFPCLSALTVMMAAGLSVIRARLLVAAVVVMCSLGVNVYALTTVYRTYWADKRVPVAQDVAVPGTVMNSSTGPLDASHSFTQSFIAKHNGLSGVDVEVASYGQAKQGVFHLSLLDAPGGHAIAETALEASAIPPCCIYAHLNFTPLLHSLGKKYLISVSSTGFTLRHGVTVFLSGTDVYRDGEFVIDGKPTGRDTSFRTFFVPVGKGCPACQ